MKRLPLLLKKDFTLGIKNIYIALEIAFAVFMAAFLLFIIPEDIQQEQTSFIWDRTGIVEGFIEEFAPEEAQTSEEPDYFVSSREEIIEGMRENRSAVGLIIERHEDRQFKVQLLTQPYTTETIENYVRFEMEDLLRVLTNNYPEGTYNAVRITALQHGLRDEIPLNKKMLPPVLLMMVGVLGLFAMISLVGQEREDETIRAFKVSPGKLGTFLLSKGLVIIITGFITFSILYLPIMGTSGYLESLLVIILTLVFSSALGALLSSFLKNPLEAILWIMVLVLILALPAVSLFYPVFHPPWLRIIPSYYTLFGLDAAMFPDNNRHIIWQSSLILACISIVLIPISGAVFAKITRKEV
ncbi:MAG: ABC transporter permease [Spirochaetia bacterium]